MPTFSFDSVVAIRAQVETFPGLETGGLLFGHGEHVLYAVGAGNEAACQDREFTIGPEQQAHLIAEWDHEGYALQGSYHSHPNGDPRMSQVDAATAAHTGLLLIVAPGQQWQWRVYDPVAGAEVAFTIAPPYLTAAL